MLVLRREHLVERDGGEDALGPGIELLGGRGVDASTPLRRRWERWQPAPGQQGLKIAPSIRAPSPSSSLCFLRYAHSAMCLLAGSQFRLWVPHDLEK